MCQRIKSNPDLGDTKVLIVSGVVSHNDISRLSDNGADGFIKKPFSIENLLQQIEELLEM